MSIVAAAYYISNRGSGIVDNEYITDDGLYLLFNRLNCSDSAYMELSMGLSPVKGNDYDSCVDVNILMRIYGDGGSNKEIDFTWGAKGCAPEEIRRETLRVPLSTYFDNSEMEKMCKSKMEHSIALLDYRFIKPVSQSGALSASADPLGQQARLASSIPIDIQKTSSTEDYQQKFTDEESLKAMQMKLVLLTEYSGPIDGKWNASMEKYIKTILNENYVFYEAVKSYRTLKLLGMDK